MEVEGITCTLGTYEGIDTIVLKGIASKIKTELVAMILHDEGGIPSCVSWDWEVLGISGNPSSSNSPSSCSCSLSGSSSSWNFSSSFTSSSPSTSSWTWVSCVEDSPWALPFPTINLNLGPLGVAGSCLFLVLNF